MSNLFAKLKKPIVGLSPMDGITDYPMRTLQAEIAKPDVMFTEFVSVEGLEKKPERFLKQLRYSEKERPIIAQVFGATPSAFSNALKIVIELGFDGVDINMGCPDRAVVKKGAGGALIGNYSLSGEIINSCFQAISESKRNIPLSVKTRIGKTNKDSIKWIQHLSSFPLAAITIHGRRLSQGVAGEVNWQDIKDVSEIVKKKEIILLGNGGIKSIQEARIKCSENNLDGVLIGQAALGNPWIFRKDYQPNQEEILQTILKHARLAWDFYGEKGFVMVLKHFGWYSKNFPNSKKLRVALLKTRNYDKVEKVILDYQKREKAIT